MIFACAQAVAAELAERGFPIGVECGPTRLESRGAFVSRVVFDRDTSPDRFGPPRGVKSNPPKRGTRYLSAKATIWAQCTQPGAIFFEHTRECDRFIDAVFCAIQHWTQASGHDPDFSPSGRYLRAEDFAKIETWPGVVYELTWQIPRVVFAIDYDGSGLLTGTPAATSGVLNVRRNGDDTPEIAT